MRPVSRPSGRLPPAACSGGQPKHGRAAGCADPHPGPGPYAEVNVPTAVWKKAAAMTGAGGFTGRVALVIPTYSDKDNIRSITARLRSAIPFADLLIVDHNSPGGTGRIAGEPAAADKGIRRGHAAAGIRSGGLR
jgi:hypothetical protein